MTWEQIGVLAGTISAGVSILGVVFVGFRLAYYSGIQAQKLSEADQKIKAAHERVDSLEDGCEERCGLSKLTHNNLQILIEDFQDFRKKVEKNLFNIN